MSKRIHHRAKSVDRDTTSANHSSFENGDVTPATDSTNHISMSRSQSAESVRSVSNFTSSQPYNS